MALLQRFSRLLRADLHAVLDNLEEPDILLRQAIRDMEAAQDSQQAVCDQLERDGHHLDEVVNTLDGELATLSEQLDRCFAERNDNLIRAVIKRRLEAEYRLKQVAAGRDQIRAQHQHARSIWSKQAQRLDALRQQIRHVIPEKAVSPSGASYPLGVVSDLDVELAILRERQLRGVS